MKAHIPAFPLKHDNLRVLIIFLLTTFVAGIPPVAWAEKSDTDTVSKPAPIALPQVHEQDEEPIYPKVAGLSPLEREIIRDLNLAGDTLDSPYLAMANYLLCLQAHYYMPELALRSMNVQGMSHEDALQLSSKLKRVLDGRGVFIHVSELPREPDYSEDGRLRYTLSHQYPELYMERIDGHWMFPRSSLQAVNGMYDELYPLGIDLLLSWVPQEWQTSRSILGLNAWNVSAIASTLVILFIAHKLLSLLLTFIVKFLLVRIGLGRFANKYIAPTARPLSIVLILHLALLYLPAQQLNPQQTKWILYALNIIIPVFITIILFRLTAFVRERLAKRAEKTEGRLDDQLVPILTNLLRAVVVIVGVFLVASNLNVDLTALIAGLSIGGLAVALAAQDTVKNFFGSLVIFLDKPFQIGQLIDIGGGTLGIVESVGVRATRLRTLANSLVYVPNGQLAEKVVDNLGMREFRRFSTHITVQYDTPPDLIEAYIGGLREAIATHPLTRKEGYEVHLNNMSSSSIDIIFHMFFAVPGWAEELKARHDMLMAAIRIAKKLNVQFAFPTQTLHMENFPGQPSLSADYTLDKESAVKVAKEAMQEEQARWRAQYTEYGDKEIPPHMD